MSGRHAQHTKSIPERIAAKGDGWPAAALELPLTCGASLHCLIQKGLKVFHMKVDVNGCPLTFMSANVTAFGCRFAASGFLDQSDLRISTLEDRVGCHWSGDFEKAQSITIKSQPFID